MNRNYGDLISSILEKLFQSIDEIKNLNRIINKRNNFKRSSVASSRCISRMGSKNQKINEAKKQSFEVDEEQNNLKVPKNTKNVINKVNTEYSYKFDSSIISSDSEYVNNGKKKNVKKQIKNSFVNKFNLRSKTIKNTNLKINKDNSVDKVMNESIKYPVSPNSSMSNGSYINKSKSCSQETKPLKHTMTINEIDDEDGIDNFDIKEIKNPHKSSQSESNEPPTKNSSPKHINQNGILDQLYETPINKNTIENQDQIVIPDNKKFTFSEIKKRTITDDLLVNENKNEIEEFHNKSKVTDPNDKLLNDIILFQKKKSSEKKNSENQRKSFKSSNSTLIPNKLHNQASSKMSIRKTIIDILDINEKQRKKQNSMIQELTNFPRPVIMISKNLKILFQNKRFSELLLQDKNELFEQSLSSIISANDQFEFSKILKSSIIDTISNINNENMSQIDFNELPQTDVNILDKNMRDNQTTLSQKPFVQDTTENESSCTLILYFEPDKIEKFSIIIDPRNSVQLFQSIIIFLIIMFLMFQVPQDIAFGDEKSIDFNFTMDMFTTAIFTLDILLNFLVTQEKPNGKYETDVLTVAKEYLVGSFLFDVFATVPFDQVVNWIAFNTSVIKSIKIIKIVKIMKILKVTKIFNIKNNVIKDSIGQEQLIMLKRASGFFELMRQNMFILIGSHFYTILFYYLKTNAIPQADPLWLQNQFGIDATENMDVYLLMLTENVKTALGLGTQVLTNPFEITLQLSWMFIGLSIFGQGIGNISSLLNHTNQHEIEQESTVKFFSEVCDQQEVDPRIATLIKRDIEEQYKDYYASNLFDMSKTLTKEVFNQLETCIYLEFVNSFSLLPKLSISIIRFLKTNLGSHLSKPLPMRGSPIKEIQFITGGKLSLQNGNMSLVNHMEKDEMFGYSKFIEYIWIKQSIDLDSLIEDTQQTRNDNQVQEDFNQVDRLYECRDQIHAKIQLRCTEETEEQELNVNSNANETLKIQEDYLKVQNDYLPVCDENITYFTIPFACIEKVIIDEFEAFVQLWIYQSKYRELISEEEGQISDEAISTFENSTESGIIITIDGLIQDVNDTLSKTCPELARSIVGLNILEIIRQELVSKIPLNNISDISKIEYKVWCGNIKKIISIKSIKETFIRPGTNVELSEEDNELDDKRYQQLNLKKCLKKVKFIQFDISQQYAD